MPGTSEPNQPGAENSIWLLLFLLKARETAPWLRAHTEYPEDLSSVPAMYVRCLTPPKALLRGTGYLHTCTLILTQIIKINNFFKGCFSAFYLFLEEGSTCVGGEDDVWESVLSSGSLTWVSSAQGRSLDELSLSWAQHLHLSSFRNYIIYLKS